MPKLCECGCGQPTSIARASSARHGHVKGQPMRFVKGHRIITSELRRRWSQRFGTLEQRLWKKVNKNGPIPACRPELGPCWQWTGKSLIKGYGTICENKKGYSVHRLVYTMLRGAVPEGLDLDHLCRNRACCNPHHLEPVTRRENLLRSPIAPTGINDRKTHCKYGHEFSAQNTRIWYVNGHRRRRCNVCHREDERRRNAAKAKLRKERANARNSVAGSPTLIGSTETAGVR